MRRLKHGVYMRRVTAGGVGGINLFHCHLQYDIQLCFDFEKERSTTREVFYEDTASHVDNGLIG